MRRAATTLLVAVALSACGGGSLDVEDPDGVIADVEFLTPDALDALMVDRDLSGHSFLRWNRLSESEILLRTPSGVCWDDEYDVDLEAARVDGLVVFDVAVSGSECEGGDEIGLIVQLEAPISDADIRVRPSGQCRREGCP